MWDLPKKVPTVGRKIIEEIDYKKLVPTIRVNIQFGKDPPEPTVN